MRPEIRAGEDEDADPDVQFEPVGESTGMCRGRGLGWGWRWGLGWGCSWWKGKRLRLREERKRDKERGKRDEGAEEEGVEVGPVGELVGEHYPCDGEDPERGLGEYDSFRELFFGC